MANLKTEIILSMNGKAAIQVLEALRDKAKAVREEIDNLDKDAPDFKEQKAGLEKVYDALQSAHENVIKDTERLDHAIQNLTSTSLQNLRKALGDGRRQLQKLSEDELDQADELRKKMKQVGDEIRLIEGQYVKIADGLKNVKNQSDQWLDKAIKQQRDLIGSLEKSDAGYQKNLSILKQLEAEEDRRKGKMSEAEAHQTVTSQNASASDLRRAKTTLTEARDATPTKFTGNIEAYNNELQEIDKRLEAVSGKAQQATMSWKQMKRVLSEPNKASGEDIKRTMEVIQQKIQQLPAGSKYVADLRRQYSTLEQTLKGTRMSQMALNDILARSKQGKASLDELRRAYKQLEEELNKINTKSKEFADKQKSMKELKKNIDEVTGAANKQGRAWQTALNNLTAYVGLFSAFNMLKTYLFAIFRLNAKFAEQLTNIRKVALSTQEEVGNLSKELAKIDTRTSIEELNNLAYAGAKLGITTKDLAGFVRAADQVNVALKEDLGDEALTALAKITEVSGLIDKYGVEDAMLRTGSAIFRLASTSTASSDKIVDFSNRMLALGDAASLATPDILAIGSAVDSMALEPEVAATAFGKLVVELRKGTSSIEKDLGIAQGSLKKMIEEGKGMEAIQTIFHKMHESKNVFALNSLFKDLGSEDGARLTKVMVTMAEKVGMLDKAVTESNKAFREGTAVTTEYEMQQETATAYMERAANLFEKQFVSADAASGPVRDLAKAWYEMVDALVHNITFMTEVRMLITLLMASMKLFLNLLPTLITVLGTAGVAGAFAKLAELTTGLTGKTMSLAKAWDVVVASYNKLSFVKQMGIMGGLIGLAGVLVVKLAQWTASLYQVSAGQRVLNEVQEEGKRRAMEEQESLKRLHNVMHDTTASMDLRIEAMKKLNGAIPNLNAKINSETGAVQENTKAWGENFKRLQNYFELEGARSKLAELGRKKVDAILKLQKSEEAFANTNVDIPTRPVTSGGAVMGGQAQGAIGQAGQRAAAKRARDKAQQEYNDIVAQEEALHKKFGAKLFFDGKSVDNGGKNVGGGNTGSGGNPNRDEKNIAKDRANALIANIKAFYEEQMRKYLEWVAQMNADGEKVSEGQQKEQMDYLQSQMDKALGTARQSIATLDDGWQKFYQHMDEDVMVYDEETSKQLLDSIGKADVGELHKLFTKLSGDLSRENNKTLAENLGALLDQIFANGSKELREAAEKLLARQREIQKILNEHDYTGAVDRNTRSNFDRLGFLQPAEDVRTDSPEGLEKMNTAFDKLTTKARESITVLYSLNPESEEFQNQFLQFLSVANEGFDFSKLSVQDLKALYLELIKYSDEYTSAEKKNADERKKINDFLWNRQGRQADQDNRHRAMQQVGNGVERFRKAGKGEDSNAPRSGEMGGSKFMEDFSYNANIEQSKLEITLIQEKIAWLQKLNATSEQVAELQKSLAEKQDSYILALMQTMKQRAEAVYALYKPLEEFGTAAGQAFATMTKDAEAGRDAFKAAIGDMINSMMKQTVQMTQEYIKRRLMQKVNDKLVSTQIKKSTKEQVAIEKGGADATSAITEAAGDAKVLLTEQVGQQVVNAIKTQTQTTTATAQSAAATDVSTQAAKTEANVGLGIAEGSAKTIGSLGWWGIPLIAVITAVLNGLLGFAMGKVSSLFGKGKDNNTNIKNTKVVSGMLTYDSGNVQDLRPFVGNDGSLYWATEDSKPYKGVSLLTQPTATTINGHPSLVAENGPELVIGRETTQAMMMNNPQLLKALVNYDRNYSGRRAYDAGNIAEASPTIATEATVSNELTIAQANTNVALLQAVNTLLQRLEQPIEAKIDMYGRGKLYDSMTKANQFMKNK
jgi:TP901 family phage tail tape measure protein